MRMMANLGRIYIPPEQLDKARNAISYLSSLSLPSSSVSSASTANAESTDVASGSTSTGPAAVPPTAPPERQDASSSQGKVTSVLKIAVITVRAIYYKQLLR